MLDTPSAVEAELDQYLRKSSGYGRIDVPRLLATTLRPNDVKVVQKTLRQQHETCHTICHEHRGSALCVVAGQYIDETKSLRHKIGRIAEELKEYDVLPATIDVMYDAAQIRCHKVGPRLQARLNRKNKKRKAQYA